MKRIGPYCWLLVALTPLLACGGGATPRRAAAVDLRPWPAPTLAHLEPGVRAQLTEIRQEVTALLAELPATAAEGEQRPAARQAVGEAFANLARHYHAYELWTAAEPSYDNALRLLGPDPRLHYQLGQLHLSRGLPDQAVVALRRAIELDANIAMAWVTLGRALGKAGQGEEAAAALDRALDLQPSAMAHFLRGRAATDAEQPALAITHFQAALRLQPDASAIQLPLALAYRSLGDQTAAEAAAAQRGDQVVVVDDPWMLEIQSLASHSSSAIAKGTTSLRRGDGRAAAELFREALRDDPQSVAAQVNLGAALLQLGQLEEAAASTRKALAADSRNPKALYNLAQIAVRRGDDKVAVGHYRAALETEPDHFDGRFNLANALLRLGRFEDCAVAYGSTIELMPEKAEAWLGEVVCLTQLGDMSGALRRTAAGRSVVQDVALLGNAEARLLAAGPDPELRDGNRALALVRPLMATDRSSELAETLAMALAETGDFNAAMNWQRQAIAAVRLSPRQDLLPGLEANLARYKAGQPCRKPWRGSAFGGRWN